MTVQRENVWSEYFRPKKLDDIKGQPAVDVLKAFVKNKNVVDCTLVGPPGCGKTSAVMAMAHELYDPSVDDYSNEAFRSCFKVINASVDRGIDTVRDTIKNFTEQAADENVGFLVCYLDEADGFPPLSQDALKSTIEAHSDNCRFILSCNNPSKLDEAILSRGPLIPFFKIDTTVMTETIMKISDNKKFKIEPYAIKNLVDDSNGDMRKMMKKLQIAYMMSEQQQKNKEPIITTEILDVFIHRIDDSETKKMLIFLFEKDFAAARASLDTICKASYYDGGTILSSIERVMKVSKFPNEIVFWKYNALIKDCQEEIKKSSNPMNSIMALMMKMILTIQIPMNCINAEE